MAECILALQASNVICRYYTTRFTFLCNSVIVLTMENKVIARDEVEDKKTIKIKRSLKIYQILLIGVGLYVLAAMLGTLGGPVIVAATTALQFGGFIFVVIAIFKMIKEAVRRWW